MVQIGRPQELLARIPAFSTEIQGEKMERVANCTVREFGKSMCGSGGTLNRYFKIPEKQLQIPLARFHGV